MNRNIVQLRPKKFDKKKVIQFEEMDGPTMEPGLTADSDKNSIFSKKKAWYEKVSLFLEKLPRILRFKLNGFSKWDLDSN